MTAALVQHAASPSGTATFGANTTIGNCLIACVQGYGASAITAVTTGSTALGWTQLKAVPGAGQAAAIWICPACTVSNSTVTFTASGASQLNIQAYEFSGMGSSPSVDGTPAAVLETTVPNSTSWSSGSSTAASTADVLVGMLAGNDGSLYSVTAPASPWLTPGGVTSQVASHEYTRLVSGYQIPGSAGSFSFASTMSTNGSVYAAIALAITPGGGTGGGSSGSFLPFFA